MKTSTLFLYVYFCLSTVAFAQDWRNIPVPANPGSGFTWQLQNNFSDDFNYNGKTNQFSSKWRDGYFNAWTGPGLTQWQSNHSNVSGGNLVIRASRNGANRVNCGVVTSKTKVTYPIFMEANIKVSNLELSSNFWMLSQNDQREIDILEVYGGARQVWFAQHMSTNFHVFVRGSNNQIISDFNDQKHNSLPGLEPWRNKFHRFGVYWKSPSEVFFYIDGKQTPSGSWAQARMFDKDYTKTVMDKNRFKMDQSMFMILDMEDHAWRSAQGIVATNADLANNSKNRMYVDWVRVYKPVRQGSNPAPPSSGGQSVANGWYSIKNPFDNQRVLSRNQGDHKTEMIDNGNFRDQQWYINHLSNNIYTIKNGRSDRFMEVPYARCANGEVVKTYTSPAGAHQRWKIERNGANYSIRPAHCQQRALDRTAGQKNATLTIYDFNVANNNQKWQLVPTTLGQKSINQPILTFRITPNPVPPGSEFTTVSGITENDLVQVYTLQGKQVLTTKALSDEVQLDTSSLASGMYMISSGGQVTKLIVN